MKNVIFILLLFFAQNVLSQKNMLQNGPMLGYSTMHEIMIWAQTTKPAEVKVGYHKSNNDTIYWTNSVQTSKNEAYTAHLLADEIKPGTKYIYNLYINNIKIDLGYETSFTTKPIWAYRNDPPEFSFAAGSGAYISDKFWDRPGSPYGGQYEIYEAIADKKPNFMLWLGDNIYLRQNEWNSWTGIVYRYTKTRSTPEIQKLFSNTHNYAILDDHDMGPNDSDGSYPFKNLSIAAFMKFWANPPQVANLKSATTFFNWNDADFFLLDNRYYRSANYLNDTNKTMLGKLQLDWLKNALTFSKASFKFIVIGGQFLTTVQDHETYSNYGFDKERQEIIDFIYNQNIKNVVFLTGDRHFTELSILKTAGKPTIYDLTLSSLTSRPNSHGGDEENLLRIDGTVIMERNFGILNLSGEFRNRTLKITVFDRNGNELWTKEFNQE